MKIKNLKRLARQGTQGPWEADGMHNLVICGGSAPKKALHEWKVKVAEIPMTDQVTGLLSAKERDANVERIVQLPEVEAKLIEAIELLQEMVEIEADMYNKVEEFLNSVS